MDWIMVGVIFMATWGGVIWSFADGLGPYLAWRRFAASACLPLVAILAAFWALDVGDLRSRFEVANILLMSVALYVSGLAGAALNFIGWYFHGQFERNHKAKTEAKFGEEIRP